MAKYFITYRHGSPAIDRIAAHLFGALGRENVVVDQSSFIGGGLLGKLIAGTLAHCVAVVPVIDVLWVSDVPRLKEPDDWVHREIATALRDRIPVVPLLFDGEGMPPIHEMPEDLRGLGECLAQKVSGSVAFIADMEKLVDHLQQLAKGHYWARAQLVEIKRLERTGDLKAALRTCREALQEAERAAQIRDPFESAALKSNRFYPQLEERERYLLRLIHAVEDLKRGHFASVKAQLEEVREVGPTAWFVYQLADIALCAASALRDGDAIGLRHQASRFQSAKQQISSFGIVVPRLKSVASFMAQCPKLLNKLRETANEIKHRCERAIEVHVPSPADIPPWASDADSLGRAQLHYRSNMAPDDGRTSVVEEADMIVPDPGVSVQSLEELSSGPAADPSTSSLAQAPEAPAAALADPTPGEPPDPPPAGSSLTATAGLPEPVATESRESAPNALRARLPLFMADPNVDADGLWRWLIRDTATVVASISEFDPLFDVGAAKTPFPLYPVVTTVFAGDEAFNWLTGARRGNPPFPGANLDLLQFSVTAPRRARTGSGVAVVVWAHAGDVGDLLARAAGDGMGPLEGPATASRLSVRLRRSALVTNLAEQSMIWDDGVVRADFTLQMVPGLTGDAQSVVVDVFIDRMKVGRLDFSIAVGDKTADVNYISCSDARVQRVYACFADEDRDDMVSRIARLRSVAPSLHIDASGRVGRTWPDWEARMGAHIRAHDCFYLFWSANAARSIAVRREWSYALAHGGAELISGLVVSADAPPLPSALDGVRFYPFEGGEPAFA